MLQVDGTPGQNHSGMAGVAAIVRSPGGQILAWRSCQMPAHTSNAAEYQALIVGLQLVLERYGRVRVRCLTDSQVAVEQLSGRANVRADGLAPLYAQAAALATQLAHVTFIHIPRDLNRLADALAWEALSGRRLLRGYT
ncbi:reverse transcriptase-like protein [Candidatus Oscillochloris fontis]|uniref:reverse transcriptase-like protein n=1 Tax=Candidatus Oscillochloris fontis TaxID=2496868 RepID=UPI001EE80B72|nr:reverse transcriptase-like protein [Candidatus Oscillochloris fontis]